jgi:hypothetical protein
MLNLYAHTLKNLNDIEEKHGNESDVYADLSVIAHNILEKIDPSIRVKIQKKGISIIQNIYTGFDTEYKNINITENKLISVQLAVNTKTLLKVPKYTEYKLSSLHTLTGEEFPIPINRTVRHNSEGEEIKEDFNFRRVEASLNNNINEIRKLKYNKNDASIGVLLKGLVQLKIPFVEKDDCYIFSFPRTPIQPFIYHDDGSGYSLVDLIKQANLLGGGYLKEDYDNIIELLKQISNRLELQPEEEQQAQPQPGRLEHDKE